MFFFGFIERLAAQRNHFSLLYCNFLGIKPLMIIAIGNIQSFDVHHVKLYKMLAQLWGWIVNLFIVKEIRKN